MDISKRKVWPGDHSEKKAITIVGIGLAIWSIVTFDWFKAGIGAVMFFGAFLFDLFKNK